MYMIRNYQNTFKRIIDNGILIISLYGYDKTSIRDISYKSKIKESTFYHYFESKITKDEVIEQIKTNTRQYAKRQMTWFRKDSTIEWFQSNNEQEIIMMLEYKLKK